MNFIYPILALLGGLAVGIQAIINGGLGKKTGTIEASFLSFSIGTLALLFIVLFFGKGNITAIASVPKWQLTGGLLGAFYVFIMVLVVPKLGVASSLMAVIVGQLLMGAIIDHFGLFGGKQIPFDGNKLFAVVIFFIAIYFFYRK
ncbi:DMT family transporter [Bacillus sp. 31A1R]|uniref:DMT family transporter n=1 Tax=Robertmurraya mangrovi TaxID=3098077 RepID=A0ABU5IYD4_9BACI|nr:DMT family transporter [Bacillus sp. 31A1R]MDZ5472102.1 DMT family transporter [Bacillus sp. 31A1R]